VEIGTFQGEPCGLHLLGLDATGNCPLPTLVGRSSVATSVSTSLASIYYTNTTRRTTGKGRKHLESINTVVENTTIP